MQGAGVGETFDRGRLQDREVWSYRAAVGPLGRIRRESYVERIAFSAHPGALQPDTFEILAHGAEIVGRENRGPWFCRASDPIMSMFVPVFANRAVRLHSPRNLGIDRLAGERVWHIRSTADLTLGGQGTVDDYVTVRGLRLIKEVRSADSRRAGTGPTKRDSLSYLTLAPGFAVRMPMQCR